VSSKAASRFPTITRGKAGSGQGAVGFYIVPCCKPEPFDELEAMPWCLLRLQRGHSLALCPWCSAAWEYLRAVHA